MKRFSFLLVVFMALWSPTIFAVPQNVSGGVPVPLDGDGEQFGADFTAQNVTESTLTVSDGQNVNTLPPLHGITTAPTDAKGFIIFAGTSTVNGPVGVPGQTMHGITGGANASTLIFTGNVQAATFTHSGTGTVQFNAGGSAAVTFQSDGTVIIGANQTLTGAMTNLAANNGTLTLQSASQLTGVAGQGTSVGPLKQINVLQGNATIVGATSATNFSLGTNTLNITGALALPVGTVINTKVISSALFGHIFVNGAVSIDPAGATVNVDASQALLAGNEQLLIVNNNAAATTQNAPITVTSNNIRYTFVGDNFLPGIIRIIPTLIPPSDIVTNPNAGAVGAVWNALLPVAAANPGSDLAFVELQLNSLPDGAALEDALLQMGTASGLIGVNRESFNTAKQFQRVWLEHLQRNRDWCRWQSNCCDPCNVCYDPCNVCCDPCRYVCEGPRIWADGFGYFGHQDDRNGLNGYRVNTWGTMLAVETPLLCGWRAGVGAGVAYSDLNERAFGNFTTIHNYQGTIYLSYDSNTWFLDGGFSYGWNRYKGERHIVFAEIDRVAEARYNGQEYTGFASAGYQYYCNCFEITPLASMLYSHLNIDAYSETGAISLDLDVDKQNYSYLESGLGLKIAYLLQTCCGSYIPEVHSLWLYDFYGNPLEVNASFVGLGTEGGIFTNMGPRIDRNTWDIGASITCMVDDRFSIMLAYDYERSSSYFDHVGLIRLSYDF